MNAQLKPFPNIDAERHAFHSRLAHFNARRFKPALPDPDWATWLRSDLDMLKDEGEFLEAERMAIRPLLSAIPGDADAFLAWFESLRDSGPGQGDALFPWLADHAGWDEMRWFLGQEVAGEAGFDDLVALTQVRFPAQPKLEMARNYWDEMGRGHAHGMHGGMLEKTAEAFGLATRIDETIWQSLALANTMAGLAANRRYAYHSVGALGVIELTAPSRVSFVNDGLQRLGVAAEGRQYFHLHANLDIRHSREWNAQVIRPLVESDPSLALPIAEGALMRLRSGQRCFERYRAEFGL